MDTDANDLAGGLSNCITRDGQGKPTQDISWNSHRLTTLAPPQAAGDALSLGSTPASEITAILGAVPWTAANLVSPYNAANLTAAVLNSVAGVGQLLGTSNLTPGQLNAQAGQTLYGTGNLTAGQLNNIAGVGQLFGTSNLTAGELNNIAGQALYGTGNLTQAAVNAIIGGLPALSRTGNRPYIGYDGVGADVQIDGSYFGRLWSTGITAYYQAGTGYIKFPNGHIIAWGVAAGGGGQVSIGYPIAFNYVAGIYATVGGDVGASTLQAVNPVSIQTTYWTAAPKYITFGSGAGYATNQIFWMAMGW